jgi:DNA-binding transcriptional MocR family regulator
MYLTVALKGAGRDVQIAEQAARQNLWIWPLSRSYQGKVLRQGFILGFGSTTTGEIPGAVRKLRSILTSK